MWTTPVLGAERGLPVAIVTNIPAVPLMVYAFLLKMLLLKSSLMFCFSFCVFLIMFLKECFRLFYLEGLKRSSKDVWVKPLSLVVVFSKGL